MSDSDACKTAVDFQALDQDTLADEAEGWGFFHYTVKGSLVKNDGVLRFVLDLSFGPLLLLRGLTAS
jgi:hypothetical protein